MTAKTAKTAKAAKTTTQTIWVIETSLDDLNPQVIGYVLERALALGALDAYTTPAQMKKNRPGVVMTILSGPGQRAALVDLVLEETTTLGVRVWACKRIILERVIVSVATPYGDIAVKVAGKKATPEYEDCRAAALQYKVPLLTVIEAARAALQKVTN